MVNLSFVIDARDFFHDFRPETLHCSANPHWENFTNLCLTSDVLRGHEGWELLDTAACAAMKMPKLKRQTLWTGGKRYGCVFEYFAHVETGKREVCLRSTWGARLGPHT